jgi:hypothetical protein
LGYGTLCSASMAGRVLGRSKANFAGHCLPSDSRCHGLRPRALQGFCKGWSLELSLCGAVRLRVGHNPQIGTGV